MSLYCGNTKTGYLETRPHADIIADLEKVSESMQLFRNATPAVAHGMTECSETCLVGAFSKKKDSKAFLRVDVSAIPDCMLSVSFVLTSNRGVLPYARTAGTIALGDTDALLGLVHAYSEKQLHQGITSFMASNFQYAHRTFNGGSPLSFIGTKLYHVGVSSSNKHANQYNYTVYARELIVREIRIGQANHNVNSENLYGPGDITYVCESDRGYLAPFSPINKEIIGGYTCAGRESRAYTDRTHLIAEAELMAELVRRHYKDVGTITITV